jgi:hypothetical protein
MRALLNDFGKTSGRKVCIFCKSEGKLRKGPQQGLRCLFVAPGAFCGAEKEVCFHCCLGSPACFIFRSSIIPFDSLSSNNPSDADAKEIAK